MRVEQLALGALQTNCYIIYNQDKCIIVDPGGDAGKIIDWISQNQSQPLVILLTHAHFDHIGAVDEIRMKYEVPVYVHQNEAEWLLNPSLNGSQLFFPNSVVRTKQADHFIMGEGDFQMDEFTFRIFETPGHSPGSISFYNEEFQFVIAGDALFNGSIGRTDLPGGDYETLIKSIKTKLLTLPEETIVFPGHGPRTTIKREKLVNPFLQS
ncbi:MBL fold metallo-hydrolase [Bacillus kwashiorkori]|uniref:MBL fold metallo-hydrolase n=1 Tax=Bacillus kwashiorkori TaxID=1522318 RepID=UPI000780D1B5|nr:MBL fold metallo-hydrolase [Bacillus kwashiorkori]